MHADNCFVTLTYNPEHLPEGGNLCPQDLRNWIKRFRKAWPARVRFFAVGEYGDESWRPHYHLSLFGAGPECASFIERTWRHSRSKEPMGFTSVYPFSRVTAQYVAGYTTKKMTSLHDPRLGGRHPEFSRMSNRPGIGRSAVPALSDALQGVPGVSWRSLPMAVQIGRQKMPLGRYLTAALRDEFGLSDEEKAHVKGSWLLEESVRVQELQKEALGSGKLGSISSVLERESAQAILNLEKKFDIWKSRSVL